MRELTEKQRIFAEDYVKHGVARKAALNAGYSGKRAEQQGYGLLNDKRFKHVQDYIAELRAAAKSEAVADLAELQAFWTRMIRGEVDGADMKDRLKSSELMGKSLGGFVEKREHSGEIKTTAPVVNLTLTTKAPKDG